MTELEKLYQQFNALVQVHGFDFEKFNGYSIVHHSNAIENSTLTENETIILLQDGLTPNCKPVQHMNMALDHYKALKFVMRMAEGKELMTQEKIKELSAIVLKNTGEIINSALGTIDSTKGDFRKFTVRAGNTTFMDYYKVPQRVKELAQYIQDNIARANNITDNYSLAFEANYQLVTIHPFADGNGRTSRLLMNYIQHYHKFPMTLVFSEDKADYFTALQETRNQEDISVFLNFMTAQAEKYFRSEIQKITRETKESESKNRGFKFIF